MDRSGLPPLDTLRAFDAAARHLSFTRAAEELFITQSAVSKQVIALETSLGTKLFERRTRALTLTGAGERLRKTVDRIFSELRATTAQIQGGDEPTVTVASTPAFAAFWLIPRLADFRLANPGIDIRLSADNRMVDLDRGGFDVGIRFLADDDAPAGSLRLFGGSLTLVCSPQLLEKTPLKAPEDLVNHVLLVHEDQTRQLPWFSWQVWLEMTGVPNLRPAGTITFQQYEPAARAAVEGQGVALAPPDLVADLIKDGRLVVPLDLTYDFPRAYYLVTSSHASDYPAVGRFIEWLKTQLPS